MKFEQKQDGSCNIFFSKEEIKIINKNKKIYLSAESLRHFGNNLMKVVAEFQLHFNDDIKKLETYNDTIIKGEDGESKDND